MIKLLFHETSLSCNLRGCYFFHWISQIVFPQVFWWYTTPSLPMFYLRNVIEGSTFFKGPRCLVSVGVWEIPTNHLRPFLCFHRFWERHGPPLQCNWHFKHAMRDFCFLHLAVMFPIVSTLCIGEIPTCYLRGNPLFHWTSLLCFHMFFGYTTQPPPMFFEGTTFLMGPHWHLDDSCMIDRTYMYVPTHALKPHVAHTQAHWHIHAFKIKPKCF